MYILFYSYFCLFNDSSFSRTLLLYLFLPYLISNAATFNAAFRISIMKQKACN